MSTVADVLDRAAGVIAKRGHCKRDYEGPDGAVCAVGALRVALTGKATKAPSNREFHTYVRAIGCISEIVGIPIGRWNDAPERNADEAIAALRDAARRERGAA